MSDDLQSKRAEFLLGYYNVLWDNINRHIQGVWQTVTVLGVSLALFTLVKDDFIPLSLCVSLIVVVCAWYSATVYDSSLWFARNQAIATNIERLFLSEADLRLVQPYFNAHRPRVLISHFRIALWFSRALAAVALAYHLAADVLPNLSLANPFAPVKLLPYLAALGYVVVERVVGRDVENSFRDQREKAPGLQLPMTVPSP